MIFKSHFFAASALICFCTAAAPAQAGALFPPDNIGKNPNVACPNGQVLSWQGDRVDCVNPTPGVTVSCPAGQVLTGITNGVPTCSDTLEWVDVPLDDQNFFDINCIYRAEKIDPYITGWTGQANTPIYITGFVVSQWTLTELDTNYSNGDAGYDIIEYTNKQAENFSLSGNSVGTPKFNVVGIQKLCGLPAH